MGNEQMEKMLLNFTGDLLKIMEKHGLIRMSARSWGGSVAVDNSGIHFTGMDFIFKEDVLEIGHLTIDQCLDLYNQKVQAWEITKENEFAYEAMEVMSYIKRRFKEIDV